MAELRPVVIRKIRKHSRAHGGQWKIAYADFVTAMMAFFLLMWLLTSASQTQLQGISEYFQTPLDAIPNRGAGSGDRTSLIQGGGKDVTRRDGQVKSGATSQLISRWRRVNWNAATGSGSRT